MYELTVADPRGDTRNAADLDGLAGTSIEASDPTDVDNEVVLRERGTGDEAVKGHERMKMPKREA